VQIPRRPGKKVMTRDLLPWTEMYLKDMSPLPPSLKALRESCTDGLIPSSPKAADHLQELWGAQRERGSEAGALDQWKPAVRLQRGTPSRALRMPPPRKGLDLRATMELCSQKNSRDAFQWKPEYTASVYEFLPFDTGQIVHMSPLAGVRR